MVFKIEFFLLYSICPLFFSLFISFYPLSLHFIFLHFLIFPVMIDNCLLITFFFFFRSFPYPLFLISLLFFPCVILIITITVVVLPPSPDRRQHRLPLQNADHLQLARHDRRHRVERPWHGGRARGEHHRPGPDCRPQAVPQQWRIAS